MNAELLEDDVWVAVIHLAENDRAPASEPLEWAHAVAYGFSREETLQQAVALWRSERRHRANSPITQAE